MRYLERQSPGGDGVRIRFHTIPQKISNFLIGYAIVKAWFSAITSALVHGCPPKAMLKVGTKVGIVASIFWRRELWLAP